MKFNVVVANPPFSLDKWGADTAEHDPYKRFWRGIPPKSRGDYAFISHMVETMNESDGRVGVVVPHGVLFRGSSEGLIRRRFIEENLLDGVIGLPANLFFGVGIPAALLFFRRDKANTEVLFIDASRDYAEGKNQNKLREEDIARIVQTWRARLDVAKYAHLATPQEIAENDYSLNLPLYVDTFEEEAFVDLEAIQTEIAKIEAEIAVTRTALTKALQELGL
jgi:type I restriction enzyme M protein